MPRPLQRLGARLTLILTLAIPLAPAPSFAKPDGLIQLLYELTMNEQTKAAKQMADLNRGGKHEAALEIGEPAILEYPENKYISLQLVIAAYELDRHEAVIAYAAKTLELDPGNTEAVYYYLTSLRFLDRELEAIAFAEQWIADDKPLSGDFYLAHSLALNFLDRDAEAHEIIKKALELSPDSLAIAGNYAFYTARFTSDRAAANFVTNFEERFGKSYSFLHRNLGKGRKEAGNVEGAIASLSHALDLGDTDPDTLNQLCELLESQKRYEEALDKLEAFTAANGESPLIVIRIGLVAYKQSNYDEAFTRFDAARRSAPEHATYASNALQALNLATHHAKAIDYAKARLADPAQSFDRNFFERFAVAARAEKDLASLDFAYQKAFETFPGSSHLASAYIDDLRAVDQSRTAIDWATAWADEHDPSATFYKNLALAYRDIGDTENEISCDRRAHELSPTDETLLDNLLVSLSEAGQTEEAIKLGEAALARIGDPTLAKLVNRMGILYDENDDGENSLRHFQQALDLDPDNATWAGNLVYSHHTYGDPKSAVAAGEIWLRDHQPSAYLLDRIADAYESLEDFPNEARLRQAAYELAPDDESFLNDYLVALRSNRDYETAETVGAEFLERFPESHLIWNQFGIVALGRDDKETADARYAKAASLSPSAPSYTGNRVDVLSKLGRDAEAVEVGEAWLSGGHEPSGYFLEMLAYSEEEIGRTESAEQHYRQALELSPGRELSAYRLANILFTRGDYIESEKLLADWLSRFEPSARTLNLHGVTLDETDRYAEAQPRYEQAIQLSPNYPTYAGNLLYNLKAQNKHEQAIERIGGFLASLEPDAYLLKRCGEVYYEARDYEAALPFFQEANELDPDDLDVHDYLVASLRLSDQYEAAIAECEKRIQNDTAGPWIHTELGLVHSSSDRNEEALKALRAALELNPAYHSAAEEIFEIYKRTGDEAAALSFIQEWAQENTPSASLYNKWALVERGLRHYETAAQLFERAHQQAPEDPTYLGNLVESLAMSEDYDNAIEKAEAYLATYGHRPYPVFRYAETLNDVYRFQDAISLLRESLAKHPEEVGHATQLARAFYLSSNEQSCIDYFATNPPAFEPDVSFLYYLGRCQLHADATTAATKSLSQAAALYPESAFYQGWKAIALLADRQIAAALESMRSFDNPESEYESRFAACRIVAHELSDEPKDAKKLLNAQLKRCVKDDDATRDFALTCLALKRYQLVRQLIARRSQKNGESASDLTWLARSHYEQDDFEQAASYAQKALALEADYESAAFHHLRSLVKLDRLTEAQTFLAAWQQSHGKSSRLRSALAPTTR